MANKLKNLTGQRFGKLIVIECVGRDKYGGALWECLCDCGGTKVIKSSYLLSGYTKSCGCMWRPIKNRWVEWGKMGLLVGTLG